MTLLSMNEITTLRWSLEEDIENYCEAGYQSIGVWRHKLNDYDEDRAIEMLVSSGLEVSNVLWAGGFTGSDGRSLREALDDARDAICFAAAVRSGCLVLYSGGRNNHTFRHAGRLLRMAIDELLPLAEAAEVPVAIEPVHAACAREWSFLTSLDGALELIREFNSRYLRLSYDTYHFPIGSHHYPTLAAIAPHIGIVRLADRAGSPSIEQDRMPLGQGSLALREIISTLQDAGYNGTFDVKLIGPEAETRSYWELLEHSQIAFSELAQLPVRP